MHDKWIEFMGWLTLIISLQPIQRLSYVSKNAVHLFSSCLDFYFFSIPYCEESSKSVKVWNSEGQTLFVFLELCDLFFLFLF